MSPKLTFEVVPLAEVAQEDKVILPKGKGPLILIVDDEKVIADTLSIILSRAGFTTMTAYNGETALQIATATSPALVISDVVMPGLSGVELAIKLTLRPFPTAKFSCSQARPPQSICSTRRAKKATTSPPSPNPCTPPTCSSASQSASPSPRPSPAPHCKAQPASPQWPTNPKRRLFLSVFPPKMLVNAKSPASSWAFTFFGKSLTAIYLSATVQM